ncbi:MAG TPA: bifunctional demethylmenaquinone methyltransferase/2-methoxy-6-polyprenyl-1,4-benzoquinol methylase UbiE [Bacteroidales bacterium]|nr:bifunctional demethylmenaquinone methyltransferase/2-methoxy-6-polyprenyl-1,4-benzoquinol methylase UbiE [Bacteroidales bacterium]
MDNSNNLVPIGKKEQVRKMFNSIAGKYDFLNHFLSIGIDRLWRRRLVRMLAKENPQRILDIATGTGDLAIALLKCNPKEIIGADISENMLQVGIEKIKRKKLENRIKLELGDSENLNYQSNYFDAITVAFGVRNYEDLHKGLSEMYRVTKPGGSVWILEFSKPSIFPVKQIYNFYFRFILPSVGKMVSKDKEAYTYLPESVSKFPDGPDFLDEMKKVGYSSNRQLKLTFGIASIYYGKK